MKSDRLNWYRSLTHSQRLTYSEYESLNSEVIIKTWNLVSPGSNQKSVDQRRPDSLRWNKWFKLKTRWRRIQAKYLGIATFYLLTGCFQSFKYGWKRLSVRKYESLTRREHSLRSTTYLSDAWSRSIQIPTKQILVCLDELSNEALGQLFVISSPSHFLKLRNLMQTFKTNFKSRYCKVKSSLACFYLHVAIMFAICSDWWN